MVLYKRLIIMVLVCLGALTSYGQVRTNIYSSGLTTGAQTINFDADDYGVTTLSIANSSGAGMTVLFDFVLQVDKTVIIPNGWVLNVAYGSDRVKMIDVISSGGDDYLIMGSQDNRGVSAEVSQMTLVPIIGDNASIPVTSRVVSGDFGQLGNGDPNTEQINIPAGAKYIYIINKQNTALVDGDFETNNLVNGKTLDAGQYIEVKEQIDRVTGDLLTLPSYTIQPKGDAIWYQYKM